MINLTEQELEHFGELIIKKVIDDKRFDKYNNEEIATMLAYVIMMIGKSSKDNIEDNEEVEHLEDYGDWAS